MPAVDFRTRRAPRPPEVGELVWNTADALPGLVFSNSDHVIALPGAATDHDITYGARGNIPRVSGKWYFEVTQTYNASPHNYVGLATAVEPLSKPTGPFLSNIAGVGPYIGQNHVGNLYFIQNSIATPPGIEWSSGGVAFAWDADAGKLWVEVGITMSHSWFGGGNPALGTNPAFENVFGNLFPIGYLGDWSSSVPHSDWRIRGNYATITAAVPAGFLPWGGN